MILSICDNSTVLEVLRMIKIVIRIITILVPIALIITSMITFTKEMASGKSDMINDGLKILAMRCVSAILVFMIPTFVSLVVNVVGGSSEYKSCLQNATQEGINEAKINEVSNLVATAGKTLNLADLSVAKSAVNKMKDSATKTELLNRLNNIESQVKIKETIEKLMANGDEESYTQAMELLGKIGEGEEKEKLKGKLAEMKKKIDEESLGNLSSITSYPSKKPFSMDNVTLNYYVSQSGKGFSFWLYTPNKMQTNLPMIIYLQGLGSIGDDYQYDGQGAIVDGPIRDVVKHGYHFNAVIVHMQVPTNQYVYENLGAFKELSNRLSDELKINKSKISVAGFSHGCYGTLHFVTDNPTYFSAAVLIGCNPAGYADGFKNTPVWALVGAGDGASTMPGFVEQVKALRGTAKFTNVGVQKHVIVDDSYSIFRDEKLNVIEWMTSQTR